MYIYTYAYIRQEVIERKWTELLAALEACKSTLSRYYDLMSVFSEMNDCLSTMSQIEVSKATVYCQIELSIQLLLYNLVIVAKYIN